MDTALIGNVALDYAGQVSRNNMAWDALSMLSQGSPDSFFLALGNQVIAEGGTTSQANEMTRLMKNAVALCVLAQTTNNYKETHDENVVLLSEIVEFFEARLRHNWKRLLNQTA